MKRKLFINNLNPCVMLITFSFETIVVDVEAINF